MIVNPDKFKAIVSTKARQDTSGISVSLKDHCITAGSRIKESEFKKVTHCFSEKSLIL